MNASSSRRAATQSPALFLALALLLALAATGLRAVGALRMAPATLLPAQVLDGARQGSLMDGRFLLGAEVAPFWNDLDGAQKEVLAPLAAHWRGLGPAQKRRWLQLADRYPQLPPEDQAKLTARLHDWASLSAQQRNQARLNYAATSDVAPDARRAHWEAYQALSTEEKEELAAKAKPPLKRQPHPRPVGAAVAPQPSSEGKLARVPAAAAVPATVPNPPKILLPEQPHAVQALPVPPPVVVETLPVETPSAAAVPLPPLPPADGEAPQEPAKRPLELMEPLHPPQ